MDTLTQLLEQARAGRFHQGRRFNIATSRIAPLKPLETALTVANGITPEPLPAGLSGAIVALTAAERALLDNPAWLSALVAEIPQNCGWESWAEPDRRDWVAARLGLSPTRFWQVTYGERRWFVEFAEPQARERLQEQVTRNSPTVAIEVQPALALKPVCDTGNPPVGNFVNSLSDTDMQQQVLLPDTALRNASNAVVTKVSAAELLTGVGVSVRYLAEPAQAAAALAKLAALPDTGPWGLDIETMPLPAFRKDSKAGLDPWRSSIRLVQVYPGGPTCFVFDVQALGLSPLKELLNTRELVAHNAVFELKHLLHGGITPARLGCTLLQDNALGNGRRALAALAADTLNWHMDKALQVSDWTAANLTPAQLDYAALDAVTAFRLARELSGRLQERGLTRCYQLMRDAQPAIAKLELAGCPFDTAAHTALLSQWQTMAEQARGELDRLLNGANPDSPLQLSKWLAANLPADTLETWPKTATGPLQTDADALAGLTLPALEPLKRYKLAMKGLSTYGTGYAKHISPVTGRIHASFTIGGTATGRLSCSSPNIQNPPRDPAFRALFAPAPGRCLVVADYGQIELRVAALVSGDPAMLAVYEQGQDLHRKTAAAFLGKEPSDVTKAERQIAKGINFGMLFGSGAKGLQAFCKSSYGVDLSLAQADKARAAFFTAYPGLSSWQKQTRHAAERAKQVRTPGGRVRALDRNIGTECLNTPVQGGAAECLLAALAALDVDSLGGRLVNIVHDELVVECEPEQAGAVAAEVERAMVAGFLAIFPNGSTRDLVEAHSGANWAAAKG
jgi:DNA polymerase-1